MRFCRFPVAYHHHLGNGAARLATSDRVWGILGAAGCGAICSNGAGSLLDYARALRSSQRCRALRRAPDCLPLTQDLCASMTSEGVADQPSHVVDQYDMIQWHGMPHSTCIERSLTPSPSVAPQTRVSSPSVGEGGHRSSLASMCHERVQARALALACGRFAGALGEAARWGGAPSCEMVDVARA